MICKFSVQQINESLTCIGRRFCTNRHMGVHLWKYMHVYFTCNVIKRFSKLLLSWAKQFLFYWFHRRLDARVWVFLYYSPVPYSRRRYLHLWRTMFRETDSGQLEKRNLKIILSWRLIPKLFGKSACKQAVEQYYPSWIVNVRAYRRGYICIDRYMIYIYIYIYASSSNCRFDEII